MLLAFDRLTKILLALRAHDKKTVRNSLSKFADQDQIQAVNLLPQKTNTIEHSKIAGVKRVISKVKQRRKIYQLKESHIKKINETSPRKNIKSQRIGTSERCKDYCYR